jgi:HAD superfamily hydrolase (TIGR01549 family)
MIKNILFDFDGVILDSMPVRDFGFREIFKEFDKELVEKLIEYNNLNGGLSRYVKIRYFYEELLGEYISEEKVQELAQKFSEIMRKELPNKKYMIEETVKFIEDNYKKYNLHIVSGSDGNELRYLCKELEIDKFFLSIDGSPTPKNNLVSNVLVKNNYLVNETILIGDSINDYEAAKVNNIDFYGYNNFALKKLSNFYIDNFDNVTIFTINLKGKNKYKDFK